MKHTDTQQNTLELPISEDASDLDIDLSEVNLGGGTRLRATLRILWDDWRSRIGGCILLVYLLMGTVGVLVVPEPVFGQGPRLVGIMESGHVLGTDNQGRDLVSLTVHSTPSMLKMIVAGGVFATAVGAFVGTVSGYKGGRVDRVLMTFTDMVMTIPGLPLIVVIAAAIKIRNPYLLGVLLAINNWSGLARTIRSQVLTIRNESYVEASRTMGLSSIETVRKDIIPPLMPFISVNFMNSSRRIIFESVGLYFLGVLPYSSTNWGVMLNDAFEYDVLYHPEYIYWLFVPLVTIVLFSLSLILISQGTDRIFNPRLRAKHQKTNGDADAGDVPTQL